MFMLRRLADFLLLRPFFTLWSLRVFWWMYIFVELDRLYRQINQVLHHAEFFPITSTIWNWVNLIHAPIYYFVEIATVRLLLDLVVPLIWPTLKAQIRPNRHFAGGYSLPGLRVLFYSAGVAMVLGVLSSANAPGALPFRSLELPGSAL
jgi:hypothetical protein